MKPVRVLVVDDHPLFRRGLISLLDDAPDIEVVGEAATAHQAVEQARKLQPDVVLMDVFMPGGGVEATRGICQQMPHIRVLMLTVSEDNDSLFNAIDAGASGYLLKEVRSEELIEGIRRVAEGQSVLSPAVASKVLRRVRESSPPPFSAGAPPVGGAVHITPRESELIELIARGLTNPQIAEQLELSESTVKNHIRNIIRKTHLHSRAEIVAWAAQRGLIVPPDD